jgi:hypothetical protein
MVRFVALGEVTRRGAMVRSFAVVGDLDFSGEILLLLSEREAEILREVPSAGMLLVAPDSLSLDRRRTLSSRDPHYEMFGTAAQRGQDRPQLWISEATAERLLQGTGRGLDDLRSAAEDLDVNQVFHLPTGVGASMEVRGTVEERVPVRHVIGHWTGSSDSRYGGINDQMIVVMAQYDTPPPTPDDAEYAGANDNGSGVSVMLEAIRAMQESGYQPYRTFLFVAYSAEGLEGG